MFFLMLMLLDTGWTTTIQDQLFWWQISGHFAASLSKLEQAAASAVKSKGATSQKSWRNLSRFYPKRHSTFGPSSSSCYLSLPFGNAISSWALAQLSTVLVDRPHIRPSTYMQHYLWSRCSLRSTRPHPNRLQGINREETRASKIRLIFLASSNLIISAVQMVLHLQLP